MTQIILARHGETQWNLDERFRGRVDVELNQSGIEQVELLGEYLSRMKVDAIHSSPLKRAMRTAEAIARHHDIPVVASPGIIDMDYGKWESLSPQQVQDGYGGLYEEWLNHPERVKMPGGEDLEDVMRRASSVVKKVISENKEVNVLVAHRVVNKVLICALLGLDNSRFWNIKQGTCGITTFSHESGRFVLTSHNDTCFLQPMQKAPLSDF